VPNKNSVVVFVVSEAPVFASKGGGFRNAFHCTETSCYGPVMLDARCDNLCNYELHSRLGIAQDGSHVLRAGRLDQLRCKVDLEGNADFRENVVVLFIAPGRCR
jgi:hypothetical protein